MAETVGMLIDRLSITNLKMWYIQDILYEIRRMTFEQFKEKYGSDDGMKKLYDIFKDACELNYQRNVLVSQVDSLLVRMIIEGAAGKDLKEYDPLMFKTY
jgi:hypothetical protein